MATHSTYKGKQFDMAALRMMNEHAVALGNSNMNARGDILGKGGAIVKTNEALTNEYIQKATKKPVNTDEDFALDYEAEQAALDLQSMQDIALDTTQPEAKPIRKRGA